MVSLIVWIDPAKPPPASARSEEAEIVALNVSELGMEPIPKFSKKLRPKSLRQAGARGSRPGFFYGRGCV